MLNQPPSSASAPRSLVENPDFPRSAKYDPAWVLANIMGPNALWLTEALTQVLEPPPGSRILDLGCGRAMSSIFLAREFEVQVWAADLWIKPSDNWTRIVDAGVHDRVFPLEVEAHKLPFAAGFFDAILSVDAYHYFGTDDYYLPYLSSFLKPGGRLGAIVPGVTAEVDEPPPHLAAHWRAPDFWSFHSPAWWRRHWERSGSVAVEQADLLPNGGIHWAASDRATGHDREEPEWVAALENDAGRTMGFTRIVAQRPRAGDQVS